METEKMAARKARSEKLQHIAEFLQACTGRKLRIRESLTSRDFDRHTTSNNSFQMELVKVGLRFSGGRLSLEGPDENKGQLRNADGHLIISPVAYYEISLDNLLEIPAPGEEMVFLEQHPGGMLRRTVIILFAQ